MQSNTQTRNLSEEELSSIFDKSMAACLEMEEGSTKPDEQLLEIIQNYQDVQQNIIRLGLFSPNEDFEELKTEHLKYLLLPFFIGECFGRVANPQHRKVNLQWCEIYLTEFFKLAEHYELVTKSVKQQFKKIKDDGGRYKPGRDEKISNFKETKELNLKLKNLEKLDDEKSKQEVIGVNVIKRLYQVVDLIPLNYQELEILEYKEKLAKDSKVAEQYKHDQEKPVPKMQVWNIPKASDQHPYLFTDQGGQGGQGHCHGCGAQTESELKHEHLMKVWQPGQSMPTMTLDEFADGEIKNMQMQEAMQKKAMEEAKRQEEEEDPDKDEWHDEQTLKDRYWDDWKDANEKGAGNKQGR